MKGYITEDDIRTFVAVIGGSMMFAFALVTFFGILFGGARIFALAFGIPWTPQ